jgi:hypothetical protein
MLADLEAADASAYGLDLSCGIGKRYSARLDREWKPAHQDREIAEIKRARLHTHENFSSGWLGSFFSHAHETVEAAESFESITLHGMLPVRIVRLNVAPPERTENNRASLIPTRSSSTLD